MDIFGIFKQKVLEIRKTVENFKNDHKTISKGISVIIDSSPEPINKLLSLIWEGIEKEDKSYIKLLEILEKIERNGEKSFSHIEEKLDKLITTGVTREDLNNLFETIRTSNESLATIIENKINQMDLMRKYLIYGSIFDLGVCVSALVSTASHHPNSSLIQMAKDDLGILEIYEVFSNDPIFQLNPNARANYNIAVLKFKDRLDRIISIKFGNVGSNALKAAYTHVYITMILYQQITEEQTSVKDHYREFLNYMETMEIRNEIIKYYENSFEKWNKGLCGREDIIRCLELYDWYCRKLGDRRSIISKLDNFVSGEILPGDSEFRSKADILLENLQKQFYYDLVR